MALETVFFQQDIFSCHGQDLYSMLEDQNWVDYGFGQEQTQHHEFSQLDFLGNQTENPSVITRAKRRRSRSRKNREEIENQRMTHIAVERNRRKQMNDYLSVIRSLMPESYVQRGDQASIIGGAINFVRELEHSLLLLDEKSAGPYGGAFRFPQFTTGTSVAAGMGETAVSEEKSVADIEVSMVESHADLKIRTKRQPKLLLAVVLGLQSLGFTILHLNVSTSEDIVFYCFNLKSEDDRKLTSAADIATSVHQMLSGANQEDAVSDVINS